MTPTALITGITGQDGRYLSALLREKAYRVVGTTRRRPRDVRERVPVLEDVELVEHAAELPRLVALLREVKPSEVYHLASPSSVGASFDDPDGTRRAVLGGVAVMLEALAQAAPESRSFFAGSCEMFTPQDRAQDENAPREPVSPYGDAKKAAFDLVRMYRAQGGLHASTGILFNHESPLRGDRFVTGKIVRAAVEIAGGRQEPLAIGNDVRRDWGFAGDFVRAMWAMLQEDRAEDLVIGTGTAHSVSEFCEAAFAEVGLDWRQHVVTDERLVRENDPPLRLANPARARRRLGWSPEVDFRGLVAMMVKDRIANERHGA